MNLLDIDRSTADALEAWAKNIDGITLHVGACGFGRPCIGFKVDGSDNWVAYEPPYRYPDYTQDEPDKRLQPNWESTPDAYHKHPCMCVLYDYNGVSLDGAAEQLLAWCNSIAGYGTPTVTQMSTGATGLQAVFGGTYESVLTLPEIV
jgi:hypothetical protein